MASGNRMRSRQLGDKFRGKIRFRLRTSQPTLIDLLKRVEEFCLHFHYVFDAFRPPFQETRADSNLVSLAWSSCRFWDPFVP